MTRVDELDFPHRSALSRADRADVAVIGRHLPADGGPGWAMVLEPGAGLERGHLYLEHHAGDVQVWAVDSEADSTLPHAPHLDDRLRARGAYIEHADIADGRREAAALHARTTEETARIVAETFTVATELDGHRWAVTVGPTFQEETTLVLSRPGAIRHLLTTASRTELERAQTATVRVDAAERVNRRWFDPRAGRTTRAVTLCLEPIAAD